MKLSIHLHFFIVLLCILLCGVSRLHAQQLRGEFTGAVIDLDQYPDSFTFLFSSNGAERPLTVISNAPRSLNLAPGERIRIDGALVGDHLVSVTRLATEPGVQRQSSAIYIPVSLASCLPLPPEEPNQSVAYEAGITSTVPLLSSRPGARAKIYLDFDGHPAMTWASYSVPENPPYSVDTDANTFTQTELNNITEIWRRVAEKYSPFDIDITTIAPAEFSVNTAIHLIVGKSYSWLGPAGGIAAINAFTISYNPREAFVFTDGLSNGNPRFVAEAIAHEVGHTLGLRHQTVYPLVSGTCSNSGNQYYAGTTDSAPIMGNSYHTSRGKWWTGNLNCSATLQADLSILSGNSNSFGYRSDDFGDTISDAGTVNNSASGVIETPGDIDCFAFTPSSTPATVEVSPSANGGMNDLSLAIYNQAGDTVGWSDSSSSFSASVSFPGSTALHYACVTSAGNYGDLGQYTIVSSGALSPSPTPTARPPQATATPHRPTPTPTPRRSPSSPGANPGETPLPSMPIAVSLLSPSDNLLVTGYETIRLEISYQGPVQAIKIRLNGRDLVSRSGQPRLIKVKLRSVSTLKTRNSITVIARSADGQQRSVGIRVTVKNVRKRNSYLRRAARAALR